MRIGIAGVDAKITMDRGLNCVDVELVQTYDMLELQEQVTYLLRLAGIWWKVIKRNL